MTESLRGRINKELLEVESPAGFKMVYKEDLMRVVAEYEKEVEGIIEAARAELPPVFHAPGSSVTSKELGYLDGVSKNYPGDVLGERLFEY